VNVNIIVKDLGTNGKEELKAEVVPVTLAAEKLEGASHAKPGSCLYCEKPVVGSHRTFSLWRLRD
jgi:hypothetical protein